MARRLALQSAPSFLVRLSGLRMLSAGIVAFALLYNVSFKSNEALTSGRLAVAVLLLWWVSTQKFARLSRHEIVIFAPFLPVIYATIQWALVGDPGQISRFFHLALYSYVGGILLAHYVGNLRALLWVLLCVVSLQALVLFYSFTSISYRSWLDATIVTGGNFDALNLYRAPGLTSNAGSSLSVIQSLGVLCGAWLLVLQDPPLRRRETWLATALMALCLASCAIVGRTGLYLSAIFFLTSAVYSGKLRGQVGLILVIIVPTTYLSLPALERLVPADVSTVWLRNWMLGFFSKDDQTFSALQSMRIPPLTDADSWFGHGLVSLVDGSNPSGHDSGFIQAYYSLGLIFAAMLYIGYFLALVKLLDWLRPTFKWLLILVVFALELKEPFLFKYAIAFVFVSAYWAARGDVDRLRMSRSRFGLLRAD